MLYLCRCDELGELLRATEVDNEHKMLILSYTIMSIVINICQGKRDYSFHLYCAVFGVYKWKGILWSEGRIRWFVVYITSLSS